MRSILVLCSTILLIASSSNFQSTFAATPQAHHSANNGVYTSFNDGTGGGSQTTAPSQMLEQARQIGGNNDLNGALDLANRAYQQANHDPAFVVSYIQVLTMLANIEGESDKRILNHAIEAANVLHKSKICNGQTDAELSYHFMTALGELATSVIALNERIGAQLYQAQGKIAQNLRHNPGYPTESLEILGQPLINLAKANAIKNDTAGAFAAMASAFEIGYTDFDAVANDRLFAELDQNRFRTLVKRHQTAYRLKVRQWSRQQLAGFESFQIDYNFANINGGQITSDQSVGKVTVVDLWATWCPPCREGIPHFIELKKNFQNRNVEVIGISMDDTDNPSAAVDTVKSFAIDSGINYTLGMGTEAIKKQIPGKVLLPTTLFIDRTGTVRYVAQGYHDYDQLAAITERLASEVQSNPAIETASR